MAAQNTKNRNNRSLFFAYSGAIKPFFAWPGLCLAFCILAILFGGRPVFAAEIPSAIQGRDLIGVRISRPQMLSFLENAIAGHRIELAKLQQRVQQLEAIQTQILADLNGYDALNTTHSQLLLTPQPQIEDLASALQDNRLAFHTLSQKMAELQKHYAATAVLFNQIEDQIELAGEQLDRIRQSQLEEAQKRELENATIELIDVLNQKSRSAELYQKTSDNLFMQMDAISDAIDDVGKKLASRMKKLSKTTLFTRTETFSHIAGDELLAAVVNFGKRLGILFNPRIWKSQLDVLAKIKADRWFIALIIVISVIALRNYLKNLLARTEKARENQLWPYRWIMLLMLNRSFLYLAVTLFLGFLASFEMSHLEIGLRRVLFFIFLFLLLMRWGLDFLRFGLPSPKTLWQTFVRENLEKFIKFLRIVLIAAALLIWIAGFDNLLTSLVRDILSIVFLCWAVIFWHQMKAVITQGTHMHHAAPDPRWAALARWWTYLFFGGTLLLHLAGYGNLADHWFKAWIKTVAIIFWGWMSLNAIREFRRDLHLKSEGEQEDHFPRRSDDFSRPLKQLALFVWLIGLAAGMIWAWDSAGFLYSQLEAFFNFTFNLGSLQLSIKALLSAIFCIWMTNLIVNFWRALLNRYFQKKQPLELGIKDTILTLSGYAAWALGLIMAFGILGVNATSLAVILGALSVGIGFGLQTIFNNFISGLILLFERPIQMGDIIEINGLMAEVKKINVRATLVQTFDNASVIIPNSELISQQVTNWSFKDKRLRRNLEVGVAYGSDIDLVQTTLLSIAQETSQVLKYPPPEVLFIDHADSSLIFRLRIWLYLDDYWTVPSLIRREIDRHFRKLGIEIAFPQRDLHLRSVSKDILQPPFAPSTGKPRQTSESEEGKDIDPSD